MIGIQVCSTFKLILLKEVPFLMNKVNSLCLEWMKKECTPKRVFNNCFIYNWDVFRRHTPCSQINEPYNPYCNCCCHLEPFSCLFT